MLFSPCASHAAMVGLPSSGPSVDVQICYRAGHLPAVVFDIADLSRDLNMLAVNLEP